MTCRRPFRCGVNSIAPSKAPNFDIRSFWTLLSASMALSAIWNCPVPSQSKKAVSVTVCAIFGCVADCAISDCNSMRTSTGL
eukprot:6742495-Prymnesium_polylepis.1